MFDAVHRQTPTLSVVDPRGLAVRTVRYGRTSVGAAADTRVSHTVLDAAGRPVAQRDPRSFALAQADVSVPANVRTVYSLSGQRLAQHSVDAGRRVSLFGEAGQPLQVWDGVDGPQRRMTYDAQRRPVAAYEQMTQASDERCVERWTYAGPAPAEAARNRCGRLVRHDDPAGTRTVPAYGLGGVPMSETRRFLSTLESPDWPEAEGEREGLLEPESYPTVWRYDALGTVYEQTDAQGHRQGFTYTVAGQLRQATLTLVDGGEQVLMHALGYNAAGQVLGQTAGNGVVTTATYDPASGRLVRQQVTKADGTVLQDRRTAYDPIGNVVRIEDMAQPTRYFRNQRVAAVSTYAYDSLDQLMEATGRESTAAGPGPSLPALQPLTGHGQTLTPYTQRYAYDAGGNLTQLHHQGIHPHTRTMAVAAHSNRALPWQKGDPPPDWVQAFDAHGNLRTLSPGVQALRWNGRQQLCQITALARAEGEDDSEVYLYDGGGQRVRKVSTAHAPARTHIRQVRYLPGLELRTDSDGERLSVVTATGVRVLHWSAGRPPEVPNDQARYTVTDPLGSVSLELDQAAAVLTHEGYYPFGGTAWWAGRHAIEADYKTIRYSGKEREASGLVYYGFRYYAPWQQRWLNPDPTGDIDGLNRYWFVRNSPMTLRDAYGFFGRKAKHAEASQESSPAGSTGGFHPLRILRQATTRIRAMFQQRSNTSQLPDLPPRSNSLSADSKLSALIGLDAMERLREHARAIYSTEDAIMSRLFEREKDVLLEAKKHVERIMRHPDAISTGEVIGDTVEAIDQATAWIIDASNSAKKQQDAAPTVKAILEKYIQGEKDLFSHSTLESIHAELVPGIVGDRGVDITGSGLPSTFGGGALIKQHLEFLKSTASASRAELLMIGIIRYHPFKDGNGRVARAIYAMIKIKEGRFTRLSGEEFEFLTGLPRNRPTT